MRIRLLACPAGLLLTLILTSCGAAQPPVVQAPPKTAADVEPYRTWVLGQADAFVGAVEDFAAAIKAGDRKKAQALYAPGRMYYERIEPIAEALGDFDPRIDAREGDVPAGEWRGYHWLEKALWSTSDLGTAGPVADTLVSDVRLMRAKIESASLSPSLLVAGAVELLNEVSSSKVTGEEERYSHTDLWDFQANVEGAEQVWKTLAPAVRGTDSDLAKTLDDRFAVLYGLLGAQKKDGSFRSYTEVDPKDVKALSAAVDALAEPLAQLGRHFPSE